MTRTPCLPPAPLPRPYDSKALEEETTSFALKKEKERNSVVEAELGDIERTSILGNFLLRTIAEAKQKPLSREMSIRPASALSCSADQTTSIYPLLPHRSLPWARPPSALDVVGSLKRRHERTKSYYHNTPTKHVY